MNSRSTAAGKEVFGIYQSYLQKVKQHYDDLDRDEVKAQKYLNDEAVSKGIEYLEKKIKEFDPSGEVLRQFFRYWIKTPSGLGSPLRRGVVP